MDKYEINNYFHVSPIHFIKQFNFRFIIRDKCLPTTSNCSDREKAKTTTTSTDDSSTTDENENCTNRNQTKKNPINKNLGAISQGIFHGS